MGMGDKEQQFQALVEAYSARLYTYTYWLSADKTTAEDLVQETFMRAWKALDSLKDEAAARSWLFTILQRENARRFDRVNPPTVDIHALEPAAPLEDRPENNMERDAIHQAIMKLKPEYREALVMQILAGFSYDEIAKALGVEQTTVVNRLYRAKRKLSDLLAKDTKIVAIG